MQETMKQDNFRLTLPVDFDEYDWHVKGYFIGANLEFGNVTYRINLYSPERLLQDIQAELQNSGVFVEQNIVVVRELRRKTVLDSVRAMVESGRIQALIGIPSESNS